MSVAVVTAFVLVAALVNAVAIAPVASASPVPPVTYSPGDLNGQNGWDGGEVGGIPVPFTNNNAGSNVVTSGGAYSGDQAWLYGGAYGSPGAGTAFTPDLGVTVGAPNAADFGSPVVPDGDRSVVSFAFRANAPGDGSAMSVYEGSYARDDRTGGQVNLRNNTVNGNPPGTVSVFANEAIGTGNCFQQVNLFAVDAGSWHTLEMTTDYPTIVAGDYSTFGTTTYVLDAGAPGEQTATMRPWTHGWRFCNGFDYTPGSSLKFSNSFNDYPTHQGFTLDDLSIQVIDSGSDAVLGEFSTGFESFVSSTTTVVTEIDDVDWFAADTRASGQLAFDDTYGGQIGDSAAILSTTGSNADKVQLLTDLYDDTLLSDLDGLSYSTYRDGTSAGFVAGLPALNLRIDRDNNDIVDAYLVYEPYQDLGNGAVLSDVWQTWDAIRGGAAKWWSGQLPGCGQGSPCTWSQIVSTYPQARILEDPDSPLNSPSAPPGPLNGSLGLNLGSFNPSLTAAADALTVTVGGDRQVFDFKALFAPAAPTGLGATPGDGVVDLSWTAPADGGTPITTYHVYRDGVEVGTTNGATTFQDTTANGAVAGSAPYSYRVSAENAVDEGAQSSAASATVHLFWKGLEWDLLNATAVVNGGGGVDVTRLGAGQSWIHVIGAPPVNANGTPWVEFGYEDDGNSWQGVDMFIDSGVPDPNPRISVGSLFANEVMGYARYGNPAAVEEIVFPVPETPAANGPRPGGDHSIYVGEAASGRIDYRADGTWHSTDFLQAHGAPFAFQDVLLRWRCNATGAVSWERVCVGGETITFNDFAYGDDHDDDAPQVTVTTPADGSTLELGASVPADFACVDEPGGSGLDTCVGTVADGADIDTSTLGDHDFTVMGTDNNANETVVTNTYTVEDAVAPTVTITTPADGALYDLGETVPADYSCTDVDLVLCFGTVPDGVAITTSTAGTTTFQVFAIDGSGNLTAEEHSYTVVATTVTEVTEIDDVDWFAADTRAGGQAVFDDAYGGDLGDSAVVLSTTAANADKVQVLTDLYDDTLLSEIQELGYSTYRDGTSPGFGSGLPALNLRIDRDNNGVVDAYLVYEPYQDLGNGAVQSDVWQTWDAIRDGDAKWWSGQLPGCGQATPCTWDAIVAGYPLARVLEDPDSPLNSPSSPTPGNLPGSLGLNLGSFNPNLTAGADALTVTVAGERRIFDFEEFVPVVDTTDPTVTITAPGDGAIVDRNESVAADFACTDEPGGSGLASCVGTVADGAAIDASTLGDHGFTVTATDGSGNETVLTHTYTVVDGTDPTVTITTPADGATFDRGQSVVADFACADEAGGSGLALCFGTVPDGVAIDTSSLGVKAFQVFALDEAGNIRSLVHTYTVVDVTDPSVTLSSPADGVDIVQDDVVPADFACADEPGGSGLASCVGTVADGVAVDTSTLGEHDFTVTGTDGAGNETVVTHTYTVKESTGEACLGHPFPDVPLWVNPAVDWAHCNEYMTGINGLFEPNGDITRAQVARFLYRVAGSPDVTSLPAHGFSDVPQWVEDPVRWLVANDFATGYPNGTFRPNLPITRAEVTRMLFRIEGSPSGSPAHGFSDVPAWVTTAVNWITDPANVPAYATGYPNGTFRPTLSITRAQTTRMGCRINTPPGTC